MRNKAPSAPGIGKKGLRGTASIYSNSNCIRRHRTRGSRTGREAKRLAARILRKPASRIAGSMRGRRAGMMRIPFSDTAQGAIMWEKTVPEPGQPSSGDRTAAGHARQEHQRMALHALRATRDSMPDKSGPRHRVRTAFRPISPG
jgi:hypothetical protein